MGTYLKLNISNQMERIIIVGGAIEAFQLIKASKRPKEYISKVEKKKIKTRNN